MTEIKKGIVSSLARVKALRESRQSAATAKPVEAAEGGKSTARQAEQKGGGKMSRKAEELEAKIRALEEQQSRLLAEQSAGQAAARRRQAVEYGRRLGARLDDDTLSRILPDVDPSTAEGRQTLESFRTSNPALFAAAPIKAGDVAGSAVSRIEATSKDAGRMPLEKRKVFGVDLVKATVAKNLGGGEA